MKDKKIRRWIDWDFLICFLLASFLSDLVEGVVGLNNGSSIKIFSLQFIEKFFIFIACYLLVYIGLTFIKNKIKK